MQRIFFFLIAQKLMMAALALPLNETSHDLKYTKRFCADTQNWFNSQSPKTWSIPYGTWVDEEQNSFPLGSHCSWDTTIYKYYWYYESYNCRLNARTYDKGPKRCDQSGCKETIEVSIEDSYTAEGSLNIGVKAFNGLLDIGGAAKYSTSSKASTQKTIESSMTKGDACEIQAASLNAVCDGKIYAEVWCYNLFGSTTHYEKKTYTVENEAPILIDNTLATSQNCYDINNDPNSQTKCDILNPKSMYNPSKGAAPQPRTVVLGKNGTEV
ncbi:hypothetical protein K7432_015439 [Basidiobolus ranarum]|uniref:Secreted protein n=1 Tax=Basidiobolus ranarum TaxID=34480 RepID=A0ABR2VN24_9FUNG